MGKEKAIAPSLFSELFHAGLYKRTQGRITRQITAVSIFLAVALASYQLMGWTASKSDAGWGYGIFFALTILGAWVAYRVVNLPRFADFLIAVEAEINKVSWPSRLELVRSSIVVIFVIFFLAAILFMFDFFWRIVFKALQVIQ